MDSSVMYSQPSTEEACLTQHPRQNLLRLALDLPQMRRAYEALRVELVDVFRPAGTRGEPATCGRYLQPADRRAVAGRRRLHRLDRVPGQLLRRHLFRRKSRQDRLL